MRNWGKTLLIACLLLLSCGCSNRAEPPVKPEPLKEYMGSDFAARTIDRWETSEAEAKSMDLDSEADLHEETDKLSKVHDFVMEVEGE